MDLSGLNDAQRAAITAADGASLVIAGAGTGKTRTLVHRVAWLLHQGVAPQAICLLTFTRRAAREMLDRVADLVGANAHRVQAGTFHSVANHMLRRYASHLGYTEHYTLLDRDDAAAMIGWIRAELGLASKGRRFASKKAIVSVLSREVNTGCDLRQVLEEHYPQYADDAQAFALLRDRFTARKKQQNVMDFDDLLVRFAQLLREHPNVRTRISNRFRYLLVDEYQDTNRLQGFIACMLAAAHGNLMVVGDEAQSIYRFRGADIDNILNFQSLFPTANTHTLEQNYRSSTPVLNLANQVLASMGQRFDKQLWSTLTSAQLPNLVKVPGEREQAQVVVSQVLALREQGMALQDMAVLFRSGFHANVLEVALTEANIPYRKFGGLRFTEAAHIKDVVALLHIIANPRDAMSWFRVLQWFEGLGPKTATKLAERIETTGHIDPTPYKRRKYGAALVHLQGWLAEATALTHQLEALLQAVIAYYRPILERLYEDHPKRSRDVDTLLVLAGQYPTLTELLAEVTLDPIAPSEVLPSDSEDEWLTLSTVHSAKGLEWRAVFVLSLIDGAFPSGYALSDEASLDEERRLFYVAVTRAKQRLFLMQPQLVNTWRGLGLSPGCTLLDQLPDLSQLTSPHLHHNAPEPGPKHPDIVAAEARMAQFLEFYQKR